VAPGVRGKLERLAEAGIEIVPMPELERYFVLARDGFAALVERTGDERNGDDFGAIGSAGRVTAAGFAALVWRGGQAYFVTRQHQERATPDEVARLRRFSTELAAALAPVDG
jgi:hypothetical protein